MKRCVTTHVAAGFGTIPAGSLWDDDSEYLTDDNADCFADVDAPADDEKPKPAKRTRKAVD